MADIDYDWRDRFYDEGQDTGDAIPYEGCCGACPDFDECPFEGHEDVGYCTALGEWCRKDDPDECRSE